MLPSSIRAAVEGFFEGVARKEIAVRAASLSHSYRAGDRPRGGYISSEADALAYLATRLPPIFAACTAAMRQMELSLPMFSPASMLDLGAGPGTASLAAAEVWPGLGSFALVDDDPILVDFGRRLLSARSRMEGASWVVTDLLASPRLPSADLVVASYVLSEMAEEDMGTVVEAAWGACDDVLLIVEPGSRRGFEVIRSAREMLLGLEAHIAAPCPHHSPCPMTDDDWCHFGVRVQRSRLHREVKGGSAPFEDEPFSYVAAGRRPPDVGQDRVVSRPRVTKGFVQLKLCTTGGALETRVVPRGDAASFESARRASWGSRLA